MAEAENSSTDGNTPAQPAVSAALSQSLSLVRRHWIAFSLLLAGAAVHGTMILEAKPLLSANDRSRWCTVWSLLERGTYRIDEIRQVPGWDTIDLVYDDGHFYSTKPPILATWVAGIAWCVTRATGWTLQHDTQAVTGVTLLFANGLPLLLSWLVLHRLLLLTFSSAWSHGFLLSAGVFATLLTPFAVTLNNHSVAAVGAMLTAFSLYQILRRPLPHSFWFVLCGFASAWTCAHELPAALLGVITFLCCCRRNVSRTFIAYVPAAMIPMAFFFLTNWLATGTLKPAYASYGTEKYRFVMEGVPSYWLEPKGIDRNVDSTLVYLLHCLIGHHGLFSLTPLWVLLIPAWVGAIKGPRGRSPSASAAKVVVSESLVKPRGYAPSVLPDDQTALLTLSRLSLLLTVAVLAFYLSRTENYNYGGVSCALRWALWLTPFWIVSLIPLVERWSDWKLFRWAVVPLYLLSAFSAWSRVDNPWRQPWIFTWMESQGWIDFSEPRPPLSHALWTWIAAVPDVGDGEPRWMEFVNPSSTQGIRRLRVEAKPSPTRGAEFVRLTVTRRDDHRPPETVCDVEVNRQMLASGAKPASFVRWPNADEPAERQQADLAFLRGLPLLKKFRPGVVRYRKTLLRTDAFRCQHALSQVEADSVVAGRKWRHRCDVWLCEELPFGIAEVEFQVIDVATGSLLHQERWQAAASEPPPLPHAQWSPSP